MSEQYAMSYNNKLVLKQQTYEAINLLLRQVLPLKPIMLS